MPVLRGLPGDPELCGDEGPGCDGRCLGDERIAAGWTQLWGSACRSPPPSQHRGNGWGRVSGRCLLCLYQAAALPQL